MSIIYKLHNQIKHDPVSNKVVSNINVFEACHGEAPANCCGARIKYKARFDKEESSLGVTITDAPFPEPNLGLKREQYSFHSMKLPLDFGDFYVHLIHYPYDLS